MDTVDACFEKLLHLRETEGHDATYVKQFTARVVPVRADNSARAEVYYPPNGHHQWCFGLGGGGGGGGFNSSADMTRSGLG